MTAAAYGQVRVGVGVRSADQEVSVRSGSPAGPALVMKRPGELRSSDLALFTISFQDCLGQEVAAMQATRIRPLTYSTVIWPIFCIEREPLGAQPSTFTRVDQKFVVQYSG